LVNVSIRPPGISDVFDGEICERTLFWEHESHSAIRKGDWKLVTENGADEKSLLGFTANLFGNEVKILREMSGAFGSHLIN
jgi:hypothetical protein